MSEFSLKRVLLHQPGCTGTLSLHAAVRVEAHERKRLEQLCRYITQPALSDERVQLNVAGHVELKLKTPWRDGTTHLVMSPLELMQRLAMQMPRPRLHLSMTASRPRISAIGCPVWPPEFQALRHEERLPRFSSRQQAPFYPPFAAPSTT